eukprot:3841565-Pyramimonas_sp.AAC.1
MLDLGARHVSALAAPSAPAVLARRSHAAPVFGRACPPAGGFWTKQIFKNSRKIVRVFLDYV